MATRSAHPVNRALIDEAPLGSRFADVITGFMGSWKFIVVHLAFSMQAAYAAPLILLAGNRAAIRDRMTLEHAATEADIEEKQNERLLHGNTEILHGVEADIEQRILALEQSILATLKADEPS